MSQGNKNFDEFSRRNKNSNKKKKSDKTNKKKPEEKIKENEPFSRSSKQKNKMSKKKKIILASIASICLVGSATGASAIILNSKPKQVKLESNSKLEKVLDELYENKKDGYLSEKVYSINWDNLEKQINSDTSTKKESYQKEFKLIYQEYNFQKELETIFAPNETENLKVDTDKLTGILFIDNKFNNSIAIKKDLKNDEINNLTEKLTKLNLENKWNDYMIDYLTFAQNQYKDVEDTKKMLLSMVKDGKINDSATSENITKAEEKIAIIKNKSQKKEFEKALENIQTQMKEKEETEKQKIEEEQKKKEEEQAKIASQQKNENSESKTTTQSSQQNNSYVLLDVPYISQQAANAPMGCEGAALLQALQYKGICLNYGLQDFLKEMPMTDDDNPNNGFSGSPNNVDPNVFQSIFAAPLTKWANNYTTAENISGSNMTQLKKQLDAGNPMVVYVTVNFEKPEWRQYFWGNGVENSHIMTLDGYDDANNSYHVSDPNKGKYWVNASDFETAFNATKGAVAIK